MKPINFKEANREVEIPVESTSDKPWEQSTVKAPAILQEGKVIICLKLTEEEILEVVKTGRIWMKMGYQINDLSSIKPEGFEDPEQSQNEIKERANLIIDNIIDLCK